MLPAAARLRHRGRVCNARRRRMWTHLDDALAATPTDDYGAEAALDFYKQLLRRSRPPRDKRKKTANRRQFPPSSTISLPDCAPTRTARRDRGPPCGSCAPLAWPLGGGSLALSSLRADAVPLSSGSFDMLIQDAGKARDRVAAYRAYRELRRSRLTPTAYTLNALLNAETRSGRPSAALTLQARRARQGRRMAGRAAG